MKQWVFHCGSWQLAPEPERTEEERNRQLMAMRKAEQARNKQDRLDHSKGYCPVCHMLRSLNGSCEC